jgi:hypothetical protein
VTGQQDAEKRILNGKSQMGNGKNLTMCPLPFAISDQAGGFSAACQCWWPTEWATRIPAHAHVCDRLR